MRSITIDLPLPPPEFHPNARVNRWKVAGRGRIYRKDARELAKNQLALAGFGYFALASIGRYAWPGAEWYAVFQFRASRKDDEDNLLSWGLKATKYAIDGVVDARLVPDDGRGFLRMQRQPTLILDERPTAAQHEGITLVFTERDYQPTSNAAPSVSTNPTPRTTRKASAAAASSSPSASRFRRGRS